MQLGCIEPFSHPLCVASVVGRSLAVYYVLLTLLYSIRYWVPQARVYI